MYTKIAKETYTGEKLKVTHEYKNIQRKIKNIQEKKILSNNRNDELFWKNKHWMGFLKMKNSEWKKSIVYKNC